MQFPSFGQPRKPPKGPPERKPQKPRKPILTPEEKRQRAFDKTLPELQWTWKATERRRPAKPYVPKKKQTVQSKTITASTFFEPIHKLILDTWNWISKEKMCWLSCGMALVFWIPRDGVLEYVLPTGFMDVEQWVIPIQHTLQEQYLTYLLLGSPQQFSHFFDKYVAPGLGEKQTPGSPSTGF
eukprot:gb/GECH01014147.1/.p1 GENE.gb/GECH01014147.1/~~gb/GECH01014147.1/.p1  ORF type:complete len:183 (+),score=41.69 gb/GECH01014147.1/:1-549(+)